MQWMQTNQDEKGRDCVWDGMVLYHFNWVVRECLTKTGNTHGTSVAAEEGDVQDKSVEWQEARLCTWWVTAATRLLLWEQQELLEFLSRGVSPANVRLELRAPLCWGQPLRATEWREQERSRGSGTRVPGEMPIGNEVAGTGAAGILCSFPQSGESSESGVLIGKD